MFGFPQDVDLKHKWISLINRQKSETDKTLWEPNPYSVVCSAHFVDGCPSDKNPLPTLNLGYNITQQLGALPIYRRPNKATAKISQDETARSTPSISNLPSTSVESQDTNYLDDSIFIGPPPYTTGAKPSASSPAVQAHNLPESFSYLEVKPKCSTTTADDSPTTNACQPADNKALEKKVKVLEGQKLALSLQLKSHRSQLKTLIQPMHRKILKTSHDVHFYTGLPNLECFRAVVKYYNDLNKHEKKKPITYTIIHKYRKATPPKKPATKLVLEVKILLVLMKLRLGGLHKDLADR
jgi:hypothetical protein